MDRAKILTGVKKAKESKKRNFKQAIDLVVNLKDIDLKKEEARLEEYVPLPHGRAKEAKVCAFVGPELKEQASKLCNQVILAEDFPKWTAHRKCRKLARGFDYFIAQANIMPAVAKTFGRFLGPLGKMPNPKVGQIVPPKANIGPLVSSLKKTVKLQTKKAPVIHTVVGSEQLGDEKLADNILAVLARLKARLPAGEHNISSLVIKTTMGRPVKLEW